MIPYRKDSEPAQGLLQSRFSEQDAGELRFWGGCRRLKERMYRTEKEGDASTSRKKWAINLWG